LGQLGRFLGAAASARRLIVFWASTMVNDVVKVIDQTQ
jgi:hypothetical protein